MQPFPFTLIALHTPDIIRSLVLSPAWMDKIGTGDRPIFQGLVFPARPALGDVNCGQLVSIPTEGKLNTPSPDVKSSTWKDPGH